MACVAIFTSGNGSNFQAIAEAVLKDGKHTLASMVCNKKEAFSFQRADQLGVPSYHISYLGRSREETESQLVDYLQSQEVDLVVLAGYMKLLTPVLIDAFSGKIINIHPALLPRYPGTHGIEESYRSGDGECGITIHYVDYGMDSGSIIIQTSFLRRGDETLEEFEEIIHRLEHENYPSVVVELLDKIDKIKY